MHEVQKVPDFSNSYTLYVKRNRHSLLEKEEIGIMDRYGSCLSILYNKKFVEKNDEYYFEFNINDILAVKDDQRSMSDVAFIALDRENNELTVYSVYLLDLFKCKILYGDDGNAVIIFPKEIGVV